MKETANNPVTSDESETRAKPTGKSSPEFPNDATISAKGTGWTWMRVRRIGQMQVLNRTSLLLVVAVPIIAASWPAIPYLKAFVDGSLNQAERALIQSERLLGSAGLSGQTTHEGTQIVKNVAAQISHLDQIRSSSTGHMPWTLALLFFASLAVLLARSGFDANCPEVVRADSLEDFVRKKTQDFAQAPSSGAAYRAKMLAKMDPESRFLVEEEEAIRARFQSDEQELRTAVELAKTDFAAAKDRLSVGPMDWERQNLEMARTDLREAKEDLREFYEKDRAGQMFGLRRRIGLVEAAAKVEYLQIARQKRCALTIIAALYLLALIKIVVVVGVHSRSVAKAAGWIS